jgi:hypothetical protein
LDDLYNTGILPTLDPAIFGELASHTSDLTLVVPEFLDATRGLCQDWTHTLTQKMTTFSVSSELEAFFHKYLQHIHPPKRFSMETLLSLRESISDCLGPDVFETMLSTTAYVNSRLAIFERSRKIARTLALGLLAHPTRMN